MNNFLLFWTFQNIKITGFDMLTESKEKDSQNF